MFPLNSILLYLTVISSKIVPAGGAILTRTGDTFIHLLFTIATSVACPALAMVAVSNVKAIARVLTQLVYRDP